MNEKEAERWIVNLIRNARLDAKIDTKRGHVVMSDHATNAHQQVIEKTKHLQFRTSLLSTFIDRRMGKEKGSDVPQWAMRDNKGKGKNNGKKGTLEMYLTILRREKIAVATVKNKPSTQEIRQIYDLKHQPLLRKYQIRLTINACKSFLF